LFLLETVVGRGMHACMLLGETYPPDVRVTKEATALLNAGHEVTLVCHRGDEQPRRETHRGIDVRRYRLQDAHDGLEGLLPGARYLATYVHRGWRDVVARIVDERAVDLLHVHDLPLVRTALRAGESRDLPVVADLHENWPEAVRQYRASQDWRHHLENPSYVAARLAMPVRRWKRIERDCVRRVDRVIAVVPEGKRHYVEDCGVDAGDVTVVSNVVDRSQFDADAEPADLAAHVTGAEAGGGTGDGAESRTAGVTGDSDGDGDGDGEFVLSYVGSLGGRHRGLGTVIAALPTLLERVPRARLVIVGSGPSYEADLRALATRLGVDERVTFTGWVEFDRVPSYLAASDVCLVPHRSNGHTETTVPHKLFQYMAMARPVLVTDVGPLARIVEETDAGVVVPASEPAAMADAAAELAAAPSRAAQLGRNGRRAVEHRYSWEHESAALLDLYDDLERERASTAATASTSPSTAPRDH
jgi:glycosyltransferase involved in cell wall biosynthesis